ncbi:MAG: radical SAM protein [Lentisphaerae bacterium GWF2_44_16]|nr:MAG: radical SAM protein [Lentisphaerae bacterium GWF2_44_16]
MNLKLIYPSWRKLERQTPFNLPPHGPVVFAATLPEDVHVYFADENVEALDLDDSPDMVALSVMLTAQLPRAFAIADNYRKRKIPVIAGGIAAMLHSEEMSSHVDSVFMGEAEGYIGLLINDFKNKQLKPLYDFMKTPPDINIVGTAKREILKRELYQYRGVKMLDLIHASRGCRFNCFPCCTPFLGGRKFRPRPIEKVVEEIKAIDNGRLFVVDNSLAQDYGWEKELFQALIPLKKKWVSHPIEEDDELLELAYKAGCWYVYQAVFDTSDHIRNRIKRYHEHGIGVEATVILGMDEHDADYIKRLVDFLLEVKLDIAEFTIMTPFMHTPIRARLEEEKRIFCSDWSEYTCDRVVFQPKKMSPSELQDIYYYAWDTFYAKSSPELKMGELFRKVMEREMNDGTFIPGGARGRRRGKL